MSQDLGTKFHVPELLNCGVRSRNSVAVPRILNTMSVFPPPPNLAASGWPRLVVPRILILHLCRMPFLTGQVMVFQARSHASIYILSQCPDMLSVSRFK